MYVRRQRLLTCPNSYCEIACVTFKVKDAFAHAEIAETCSDKDASQRCHHVHQRQVD